MFDTHWIPIHRGGFGPYTDAQVFREWGPQFVKIVWSNSQVPYLEDVPPDANIIWRNHPLSEQFHSGLNLGRKVNEWIAPSTQNGSGRDDRYTMKMLDTRAQTTITADLPTPEQAAQTYATNADEVARYCESRGIPRTRLLFEGPNEYPVWSHGYTGLARLETERLRLLHKLGLRGVAINLGVGWPGNDGKDRPPLWDWAKPVIDVMEKNDYLGLHEYWAYSGPLENWGWWAGRLLKCPYRVPILVTECGIDGGVAGVQMAQKGWWDLPGNSIDEKATRYLDELWRYAAMLLADGRTQGLLIYSYDGNRQDWGRFDIRTEPFIEQFLRRIREQGLPPRGKFSSTTPVPPPTPPSPPTNITLPEHEPVMSVGLLADKVRWWMEESVRADEAGNTERAKAIRYSLIRLNGGLLYRLENALKAGKPSG